MSEAAMALHPLPDASHSRIKSFGTVADLVIAFLVVTLIPRVSNYAIAYVFPLMRTWDPRGAYLPVTIHHVAQLLLTVLLCKLYVGSRLEDWGFHLQNHRQSLKIVGWFTLAYLIWSLRIFFNSSYLIYQLTPSTVIGTLGFQAFVSGTSEEPLFRGFVVMLLAQSWRGALRIGRLEISTPVIIAALLFTYGHISITFAPFALHYSVMQLITTFVLGLVYGMALQYTRSLLAPVLMHNISNVIVVGFSMLRLWL